MEETEEISKGKAGIRRLLELVDPKHLDEASDIITDIMVSVAEGAVGKCEAIAAGLTKRGESEKAMGATFAARFLRDQIKLVGRVTPGDRPN